MCSQVSKLLVLHTVSSVEILLSFLLSLREAEFELLNFIGSCAMCIPSKTSSLGDMQHLSLKELTSYSFLSLSGDFNFQN